MHDCLELQIAESQIEHFEGEDDPVIRDHFDAQDCCQCEEFLQHGINAYNWLSRAEQVIAFADAQGIVDYTADWHELISQLYSRWLVPCTKANAWIARVESNGHKVENLTDFQRCSEAVQDWIERNEWHELARAARNVSSAEEI